LAVLTGGDGRADQIQHQALHVGRGAGAIAGEQDDVTSLQHLPFRRPLAPVEQRR
jgi:hypothetical protein